MRQNVVTVVLVVLLVTLGVGVFWKRTPHEVPKPEASVAPSASAIVGASASASPSTGAAAPKAAPKPKQATLGRPLRVVAMGWDLLAPALVAAGGAQSTKGQFGGAKLEVALTASDGFEAVERALARGGSDESGADVAIVPLPELIAAYEKLRALDLRVFFVSGWSRGREVLRGEAWPSAARSDVALRTTGSNAATFFALFALDGAGVTADRVKLSEDTKVGLQASSRDPQKRAVQDDALLSSADASRVVPLVAIASGGLLEANRDTFVAFIEGWLRGQQGLARDPPGAARSIAAIEGAPEPIALLAWLGEIEPAELSHNAELFAMSGRGALPLEALLARGFSLWRDARLSSSPTPETSPLDARPVTALVRKNPELARAVVPAFKPKEGAERTLLTYRNSEFVEDAVTERAGVLAAAFPRAVIALTLHQGPKAEAGVVIERIATRYGIDPARIRTGSAKRVANARVTLEVSTAR